MVSYEKNKIHIYKWRKGNAEKYSVYNKEYLREYYQRNKGVDPFYSYDKVAISFRRIGNVFSH